MLKLEVKGQEYRLRFGYKALGKSGILKEVTAIQSAVNERKKDGEDDGSSMMDMLGDIFDLNSRLVLAALQKHHKEFEVDYDNSVSMKAGIEKVYDFMDDYMDEEESMDIMSFFSALMQELFDSGFLSKKSEKLEAAMIEQDATMTPMDHRLSVN